jgi:hypothetical protein
MPWRAAGLPMVVTNSDVTVLSPEGAVLYMPGLYAQYYASVGGTCLVYGKPAAAVYRKVGVEWSPKGLRCLALPYPDLSHSAPGAPAFGANGLAMRSALAVLLDRPQCV